MRFEALDQRPGFGGRKGLMERSPAVDIEIILDQNDGLGIGEVSIGEVFEDVSVIDRGMAVGKVAVVTRDGPEPSVGAPASLCRSAAAHKYSRGRTKGPTL